MSSCSFAWEKILEYEIWNSITRILTSLRQYTMYFPNMRMLK